MSIQNEAVLGVLGGVGPQATVYFADLVISMTEAAVDQQHVSMIIMNHAAIHDRTKYILDNSEPNPLPQMVEDAKTLERAGADYIVIPCNTAHYFYDEIQKAVGVKIVNIVEETAECIARRFPDAKKVGILATKGTLLAGSYQRALERRSMACVVPGESDTELLMSIIYDGVKAGKPVEKQVFAGVIDRMRQVGCDCVILGCTELSVLHRDHKITDADVIDSLSVLAEKSIELCEKKVLRGSC